MVTVPIPLGLGKRYLTPFFHGKQRASIAGGSLLFGHLKSMICSVRLDIISPYFAFHPATLTDGSRSFTTLACRIDPRNCLPGCWHRYLLP